MEQGSSDILMGAGTEDVALLVVGDPLGATTHTDLILRAKEMQVDVKVRVLLQFFPVMIQGNSEK